MRGLSIVIAVLCSLAAVKSSEDVIHDSLDKVRDTLNNDDGDDDDDLVRTVKDAVRDGNGRLKKAKHLDKADEIIRDSVKDAAKQAKEMLKRGDSFVHHDRCTAIAVGPKATVDGSTFATHTNDCEVCDFRINKVAPQDWPEGSMRPIRLINAKYPRIVTEDRGFTWGIDNLEEGYSADQRKSWADQEGLRIIGYIPQVAHTYGIVEGQYGIMNEHQVAMGESTCSAKITSTPVSEGGGALLEMSELTQLGLERGRTAREAIEVMGALAEQYGYYGAEWKDFENPLFGHYVAMGEAGEGLTVVDPNEAWLFHILPDPTGASAVWAAQRVPDDHIAVIANLFVIREIPEDDSENFIYSSNMHDVAEQMGWWSRSSGKKLDFAEAFSKPRYHDDGCSMRQWRVLDLANPTLKLPPSSGGSKSDYVKYDLPYKKIDYPTSVQVSHKLSHKDIMAMNRDHFEGTQFSTTEGIAAGPYGDPTRYDFAAQENLTMAQIFTGEFERTISIHRTAYSTVCQPRAHRPDAFSLLWFSVYAPDQAAYTPIYINADKLSPAYTSGSMHKYDENVAWWVTAAVGNYANRFYKYAMRSIRAAQDTLQATMDNGIEELETQMMEHYSNKKGHVKLTEEVIAKLTDFTVSSGNLVTKTYRELLPVMFTKYRDGYVVFNIDQTDYVVANIGYPRYWLEAIGYFKSKGVEGGSFLAASPVSTDTAAYQEDAVGRTDPMAIDYTALGVPKEAATTHDASSDVSSVPTDMVTFGTFVLGMLASFVAGGGLCYFVMTKYLSNAGRGGYTYSYVEIPNEKTPL